MGASELGSETHYLYRVQQSRGKKQNGEKKNHRVQRRSISSAVIETGLYFSVISEHNRIRHKIMC